MIFAGQSREALREIWLAAWRKYQQRTVLTPLESQLADLIARHPEYHGWLADGERALAASAATDNPFLHLSLHLALQEQVATDRPAGIQATFRALALRSDTPHAAEHRAMAVLGQTLWEAQRQAGAPDEQRYLEALRRL
jgi:Domain of unknown function (DUF1841)